MKDKLERFAKEVGLDVEIDHSIYLLPATSRKRHIVIVRCGNKTIQCVGASRSVYNEAKLWIQYQAKKAARGR